jgi:hypothetical protein
MALWEKELEHLEQVRALARARGESARRKADVQSTEDMVVLADGSLFVVPRNNLAIAKELLAAQKAAERRVRERRRAEGGGDGVPV